MRREASWVTIYQSHIKALPMQIVLPEVERILFEAPALPLFLHFELNVE